MYHLATVLTDEDQGHIFSEWEEFASEWYDTPGKLFRVLQKEYGRCVSKVYVDTPAGTITTGWYFESRQPYEDSRVRYDKYNRPIPDQTYIRGAWVMFKEIDDENTEA